MNGSESQVLLWALCSGFASAHIGQSYRLVVWAPAAIPDRFSGVGCWCAGLSGDCTRQRSLRIDVPLSAREVATTPVATPVATPATAAPTRYCIRVCVMIRQTRHANQTTCADPKPGSLKSKGSLWSVRKPTSPVQESTQGRFRPLLLRAGQSSSEIAYVTADLFRALA